MFTTASQPVLSGEQKGSGQAILHGVNNISEIISRDLQLQDKLRRVKLEFDQEKSDYDCIATRLKQHNRVLCIVNTRHDAQEIYHRLPQEGITLHLSRMMCPRHIAVTIARLKESLKDDTQKVIRVVATQLIEAGVDIDFPVVYRQEAGLDSELQAAGRCNREGKQNIGHTYIFTLNTPLPKGFISNAANAQQTVRNKQPEADWFAPETMNYYFMQLYCRTNTFDKKEIKDSLYKLSEMCFESAAQDFKLIEDKGKSVIVDYENSLVLVERLKTEGVSYNIMKQLAKYSVNINNDDFGKLNESGLISQVWEGIFVVSQEGQYSLDTGLSLNNQWLEEILIK